MDSVSSAPITSVKKIVGSISTLLSEKEVLSYDIDTGFFPVSYRKNLSENDLTSSYKTKIVTSSDGDITFTEIVTQSNDGPLTGSQDDVATVLMSLYENQIKSRPERVGTENQDKVYYTDVLICDILGLSKNSANKVKRDVEKLLYQNINIYESKFKSSERADKGVSVRTLKDGTFLLIQGSETLSETIEDIADNKIVYTKYKWVQLHPYIAERIRNNMISNVDFNVFIKLKSGPRRKTYRFIQSKRKLFGDEFTFDLDELIQVLGKEGTKRPESEIKKFLRDIKKELPELNYWVSLNSEKKYIVGIKFEQLLQLEDKSAVKDDFFKDVLCFYGIEEVKALDLHEIDIINMRKEFTKKFSAKKATDQYEYNGEKINVADFAMDLVFWQVLKNGYNCTSFKGLVSSLVDSLIGDDLRLPDGYRYLIKERIKNLQKEEMKQAEEKQREREMAIRKESERQKEKHFQDFFNNFYQADKKYKKKVLERAKQSLIDSGLSENDMTWNLMLQDEEKRLVKEEFLNGEATKNSTKVNKPRPLDQVIREKASLEQSGEKSQTELLLS